MNKAILVLSSFIGFSSNKTSHREKIISGLGGFVGIFLILLVTRQFVNSGDAGLIVASMGASAVLVFAVPHGPLSQPWALGCGHLVSAIIGVSCYLLIPNLFIAAATAVGLAITAMYYLRCIHPPGGATALTAVVAGSGVHSLGYQYLITPVLINVVVIFLVAIMFNFLFHWRRYPAVLMQYGRKPVESDKPAEDSLSKEDLEHALQQMNLYVDVSRSDLEKIYQLARSRVNRQVSVDHIKLGHCYSNGEYGSNWSVRQVVDESGNPRPDRDQIIYKVIAGKGRRSSGTMSREEFALWAKYEVYLNENSWQRIAPLKERVSAA
ncbi:MAG TPA: HPP family protein [Gammaproteobacteria bacterium]